MGTTLAGRVSGLAESSASTGMTIIVVQNFRCSGFFVVVVVVVVMVVVVLFYHSHRHLAFLLLTGQ